MHILVLGAAGMLGHALVKELGQGHEVHAAIRGNRCRTIAGAAKTFQQADVTDAAGVTDLLNTSNPEWVINASGIVKQKQDGMATQIAVNAVAPHRLAALCRERGIPFLHFSTDCVFSGAGGHYSEEDAPDPVDLYGSSKLAGEVVGNDALTLRTSMIGLELQTHHGLVEWFLQQSGHVTGFRRAIFSGMITRELSRIVRLLCEGPSLPTGLLHVAASPISKYDLLSELADRLPWLPVQVQAVDQPVIDRSLSSKAFSKLTGYVAPPWSAMLDELAREIDERRSGQR